MDQKTGEAILKKLEDIGRLLEVAITARDPDAIVHELLVKRRARLSQG